MAFTGGTPGLWAEEAVRLEAGGAIVSVCGVFIISKVSTDFGEFQPFFVDFVPVAHHGNFPDRSPILLVYVPFNNPKLSMTIDKCPIKKHGIARLLTFFRSNPHSWVTTHHNGMGFPSRQVCRRCGLSRHIIETPHESYEYEKSFTFWWRYSDGRADEKNEEQFKHGCELTPPNRENHQKVDSNPPFVETKK